MIDTTTRAEMIRTLIFLEFLFAMLPGFYGVFYILGQMFHRRWMRLVGYAFGLAQLGITALMLRTGYLDAFWAWLVTIIALAYAVMPPFLWYLAKAIHRANTTDQSQL